VRETSRDDRIEENEKKDGSVYCREGKMNAVKGGALVKSYVQSRQEVVGKSGKAQEGA